MNGARAAVQSLRVGDGETHVHSLQTGTRTDGG
jgi:hypothetical protein